MKREDKLFTYEEYLNLAAAAKLIQRAIGDLATSPIIGGRPYNKSSKLKKKIMSADKKFLDVKSVLEDCFYVEHPDSFDTHVFYGTGETQGVEDQRISSK